MKKILLIAAMLFLELLLIGANPAVTSAEANINVDSPGYVIAGSNFTVKVNVRDLMDFETGQFDISFDDKVLKLDNVGMGLIGTIEIPVSGYEISPGIYKINLNASANPGISGTGYLASLHFNVIGPANSRSALVISNGFINGFIYDSQTGETPATWLETSVKVCDPLDITTDSLSDGAVGEVYSAKLEGTGGNGSYSWSIPAGGLPDGIGLSPAGEISGTPETAGKFDFTIQATDGAFVDLKSYSITIDKSDTPKVIVEQVITGSAPATIEAEDDKLSIDFPEGAVSYDTNITIKEENLFSPQVLFGLKSGDTQFAVEAASDGAPVTNLEKEITIRVKYSDEDIAATDGNPGFLALAYYDGDLSQWIELHTIVNTEEKTLTANTVHLGNFMVLVNGTRSDKSFYYWIAGSMLSSLPLGVVMLGRRRALQALQLVSRASSKEISTRLE